jgi:soluble lytic murein transglycosylase-like protein
MIQRLTKRELRSLIGISIIVIGYGLFKYSHREIKPTQKNLLELASLTADAPPCLKTYFLIEKYSKKYSVPKYIAYNIAYKETNYKGPFDWKYNPFVSSSAGAHGAMQIMLSTANFINDTLTKRSVLKKNLEYNISTSMKLLNSLYKQYDDWKLVCGCYNTGKPMINSYARYCTNTQDYKTNWVNYNN